ncbi:hypothetical protein PS720_01874 [Pseudomonas fluorescens]|nr:hypothetical protein PS720_01874 [Pseudomonas fluorescens]
MPLLDTCLHSGSQVQFVKTANHTIMVGDTAFAYRDMGPFTKVPLVLLNH